MDMIPTAKDIRGPSPLVPIENEAPAKSGTRSCCNRKEAKRADRGEFVIAVDEQNALFVRSPLPGWRPALRKSFRNALTLTSDGPGI